MSGLTLDARQRAMLDEMGVKVWWPAEPAVVAAPAGGAKAAATSAVRAMHVAEARVAEAPVAAAAEASAAEAPARHAGVRPAAASPGSAPAPTTAAAAAPRPAPAALAGDAVQLESPQRLYGGSAAQGGWLVVADMPPEPGGAHGEPLAGEAGRLLENMLRALRLDTGALPVHLMRVHRGGAGAAQRPHRPHGADGAGTLAQGFAAHAAALAPRMVLAMGPLAAQGLLQRGEPLGKLRGRVGECALLAGLPLVATYHPAYLLRNPADKARAWADLCLAAARIG